MKETADSFEAWAKKSVAMTGDVNRSIDEMESGGRPLPGDRYSQLKRLAHASGMSFFTLGPVYVAAAIPHNILDEFGTAVHERFQVLTLRLGIQLFVGLPGWESVLQAIPAELMPELDKFMSTQVARRQSEDEYWRFRSYNMLVPDPLAIESRTLLPGEPDYRLKVFLPSGNRYQLMAPGQVTTFPVAFSRLPPDPGVVLEASGGFQKPLTEDEAREFFRTGRKPVE